MMTVRPLTAEDVAPCAEIMVHNDLWQRHGITRDMALIRFENGLLDETARIQVGQLRGKVAGFIWYYLRGTFYSGAYIRLVGVDKAYQGQGLGRMLMKHAEQDVQPVANQIFLLVSDFNESAQVFYQRLGYTSIGAIPDFVTSGVSEIIYWKRFV